MARKHLILDRYELLGTAGAGGFGTVQIAWDPRIQRKVAIKTIELTEYDAYRAGLPGAEAVAKPVSEGAGGGGAGGSGAGARAAGARAAGVQAGAIGDAGRSPVRDRDAGRSGGSPDRPSAGGGMNLPVDSRDSNPQGSTADRWHGALPWDEYLEGEGIEPLPGRGFATASPEADDRAGRSSGTESEGAGPEADARSRWSPGAGPEADARSRWSPEAGPEADARSRWSSGAGQETDARAGWGSGAGPEEAEPEGAEPEEAESEERDLPAPGESISLLRSDKVTALAHVPGLDEARTAAKLSDPRIVAVYDFEVRDRTAYLIMEYVEGMTLTKLLHDYADRLTLDMVTCVFDAVAGALSAAHGAGVLHLDIKPDNILIDAKGQAKVTDFGLATLADASGAGTTGGGTIGYMPLEQMRREHLDARADEWSLAAVTYEMLTGDNPFRARNLAEAESAILDAELVLPSLCWDVIDDQIDDVIFYALDPDREERYATVEDFAEEADKFLGDPDQGRDQLAQIVEDELAEDEPAPAVNPAESHNEDNASEGDRARRARSRGTGVLGAIGSFLDDAARQQAERQEGAEQKRAEYDAGYHAGYDAGFSAGYDSLASDDEEDAEPSRRSLFHRGKRTAEGGGEARVSLSERIPARVLDAAGRGFAAVAAGLLAFFACSSVEALASSFGPASVYACLVIAIVVAVVGAVRPDIGSLASYCLFGFAMVLCGHPVPGVALAVLAALWWYITGREGMANANVTLLAPLAGSVGGASVIPFVAGLSLRPVQAGVTAAFAAASAIVFASLGSLSLVGWDIFANGSFSGVDITRNLTTLLVQPSTWSTVAGWIVGAVALSLLDSRGHRVGRIAGLALCVAAVLVGSLVFAMPTPQLFISVIVGVLVALI